MTHKKKTYFFRSTLFHKKLNEAFAVPVIQRRSGFIGNDEFGTSYKGSCGRNPLLLADAESADPLTQEHFYS